MGKGGLFSRESLFSGWSTLWLVFPSFLIIKDFLENENSPIPAALKQSLFGPWYWDENELILKVLILQEISIESFPLTGVICVKNCQEDANHLFLFFHAIGSQNKLLMAFSPVDACLISTKNFTIESAGSVFSLKFKLTLCEIVF